MNNEAMRVLRFKSDNQEKSIKKLEKDYNNMKEENDQLQVEINRKGVYIFSFILFFCNYLFIIFNS